MSAIATDEFLAHYGVKGMKWGVIRDRDKAPGKVANAAGVASAKVSSAAAGVAKDHRTALEGKYVKKGASLEDARLKAEKRAKIEKVLLITGGVAVVGLGAYVGQRELGKRFSTVNLKEGTKLTYINALGADADYNRRLYTTFNKADTKKYKGLLAKGLTNNAANTTIYETVLTAKEAIKAPSHKQASQIYKDMIKSGAFEGAVFGSPPDYKTFNQNLALDTPASKLFYNKLKSKGYNAVLDSNDQFMSGYNTKKPLILFNAASSTVKTGESVVKQKTVDGLYQRQMAVVLGKQFAPQVAMGAAAIGVHRAVAARSKHEVVNDYMAKHPNTKRDPAEVYASLTVGKDGTYTIASEPELTGKAKRKAKSK